MAPVDRAWYNLYDFVDADKRPFDHDPLVELVDIADCPDVFLSKRTRVRPATPTNDASEHKDYNEEEQEELLETSKFGDEATHVCYLRENKGVAPVQIQITQARIRELQNKVKKLPSTPSPTQQVSNQLAAAEYQADRTGRHRRLHTKTQNAACTHQ
jgi:hypothetical protein